MAAFVPAWKRLGLQLKSEEGTDRVKSNAAAVSDFSRPLKRKRNDAIFTKPSSEGVIISSPESRANIETGDESRATEKQNRIASDPLTLEPTESIVSNGNTDATSLPATGASAETLQPRSEAIIENTEAAVAFRRQRKNHLKNERRDLNGSGSQQNVGERRPYLDYLETFYKNRSMWKFNKGTQTQLLRDLLNTFRVPQQYEPALEAYVKGLQGNAARQRLASAAKKELEEKSNAEQGRRNRAEDVLRWIGNASSGPSEQQQTEGDFNRGVAKSATFKKRTRGRKRRQADSSSDDSSSSSSDSDSEDSAVPD